MKIPSIHIRSLRNMHIRLLLMFMLVMVIALGAFAGLVQIITQRDLQNYTANEQTIDQKLTAIQTTYNRTRDRAYTQSQVTQLATQINARIMVMDLDQSIIADSQSQLVGQKLTVSEALALNTDVLNNLSGDLPSRSQATRIIATDGKIVTLGLPLSTLNATFRSSVNHALLFAMGMVGLIAFGLTVGLSRVVLRPIQALKQAVRRMEQGDY